MVILCGWGIGGAFVTVSAWLRGDWQWRGTASKSGAEAPQRNRAGGYRRRRAADLFAAARLCVASLGFGASGLPSLAGLAPKRKCNIPARVCVRVREKQSGCKRIGIAVSTPRAGRRKDYITTVRGLGRWCSKGLFYVRCKYSGKSAGTTFRERPIRESSWQA